MSKQRLLKKIATIQNKVQELWAAIGTDYGMCCQSVMRELNHLEKRIESGEVKPSKKSK
jgi:hypothetical protein